MALLKRLKDWLYDRPTTILGIDFSGSALKIIKMKIGVQPCVIEKLTAVDWPPELQNDGWLAQPEEAGAFLKQCLATAGISAAKAVVSAGSHIAFVREVDFPVMTDAELDSAMQWDVEQYIPLEPGSYYYDYLPAGKGRTELEMKVLLFAAPKEWVNTVEQILSKADVELMAVETEAIAVKRLIPDLQDFLLLDMGNHTSQLTVFQRGLPVAQRNIPIGGESITKVLAERLAEEYDEAERIKRYQPEAIRSLWQTDAENVAIFTELGQELNRTADYYRVNNTKATFSAIVVTGGGWIPSCSEPLASFLHIPIRTLHPFTTISLLRKQWEADYLSRMENRMAVAVGLCLREAE